MRLARLSRDPPNTLGVNPAQGGFSLVWLNPPEYDLGRAAPFIADGQRGPEHAVLAVLASCHAPDVDALARVLGFAPASLWVARVLVMPSHALADHLKPLLPLLQTLAMDAVLAADALDAETLRFELTQWPGLGRRIATRLRFHRYLLKRQAPRVLDIVFEEELVDGMQHALGNVGISLKCAERDLHDSRLPSPRTWFAVARALRTALALQRDQRLGLEEAALANGYANGVSARKAFRVRFAAHRWEEIRAEMGWQPLVGRFLRLGG